MILAAVLSILRIIGIVLLIVLAAAIVLILCILFVPIRYQAAGSAADPGAEEGLSLERIRESLYGEFHFSWLLHLISGEISYPASPKLMVRILFFRFDAMAKIQDLVRQNEEKKKAGEKKKPAGKKKAESEEKGIFAKAKKILHSLKKKEHKAGYYLELLQRPSSERAIEHILSILGDTVQKILPRRWMIAGTVGFDDPEYTAMVQEIEGMLIPWTAGHLEVEPDFAQPALDLSGYAKGKITVFTLLRAAWKLLTDKDVKRFLHRLRHPEGTHRKRQNKTAGQPQHAV